GPGDEVITTPLTFMATVEAIVHAGARPVFADIDPATYNLDPNRVAAAVTPRTRAILPVHLYGRPADLDALGELADLHHVVLIEDACQAHGARWRGRRVGGCGAAGCFSFYPGKNLGGLGDGGMVVTNDADIARHVRALRDHGRMANSKYQHALLGFGERLDALQAAVLAVKLPYVDAWNARRREIAARYRTLLDGAPLTLPAADEETEPVYHQFVVRVDRRDVVRAQLSERGVATGVHYPIPAHRQPACGSFGLPPGSLPAAERAADEIVSLPMYPELSDENVEAVARALRAALAS
ncbi:MAG: DegT/DnrJ/EryC1/StrS family aminotransferase, partial [Candidatus Binatia bacterium]